MVAKFSMHNLWGSLVAAAVAITFGTLLAGQMNTAQAAYPDRPITIIIAWSAGGATDVVGRAIQPVLAKNLGTDIIIKNITGAAGTIGTAKAARAKPDGYTVLVTPAGPVTTQPHLRKIPYSLSSFDPIGRITVSPMLMMVPKTSPYKSAKEIIAKAKASPGKMKFASTGAGTLPHISILALDSAAGMKSKHVPFKGSANVMKALLGGVVDVFSDQAQLVPKYDLRPLAAWSAKRLPEYPNVPTMKELGYDFQLANWVGMFVPKGTPAAIKKKLSNALKATLETASVKASFDKLKLSVAYLNEAEFGKFATTSFEQNGKHLSSAGLTKK